MAEEKPTLALFSELVTGCDNFGEAEQMLKAFKYLSAISPDSHITIMLANDIGLLEGMHDMDETIFNRAIEKDISDIAVFSHWWVFFEWMYFECYIEDEYMNDGYKYQQIEYVIVCNETTYTILDRSKYLLATQYAVDLMPNQLKDNQ